MITPDQIRNSARDGLQLRTETLLWLADELEKRGAVGMSEERNLLREDARILMDYYEERNWPDVVAVHAAKRLCNYILSAPAPEPVACPRCYGDGPHAECELCKGTGYTHQPASSWVRCDVITAYEYMKERNFPDIAACRVIEAAYKDVMQAPTEDKQ